MAHRDSLHVDNADISMLTTLHSYSCDIEFRNIEYKVKAKVGKAKITKTLIGGVSGQLCAGRVNVIMGPSGAGKSTLMNALTGFRTIGATGTLVMNGKPYDLAEARKFMSQLSTYIMQDDCLFRRLTVQETFRYACNLKLPLSIIDREQRIQKIGALLLLRLALTEAADRYVDNLSGGQRKRVAIGTHLINHAPVLLLDEPTTGLDSVSTYRLIGLLRDISRAGCNVIAVIHQPNSRCFEAFDYLYVLAPGGRRAYAGPAKLLPTYMRAAGIELPKFKNPADALFEGNRISELCEAGSGKMQHMAKKYSIAAADATLSRPFTSKFADPEHIAHYCQNRPLAMYQFGLLVRRTMIRYIRDPVFFYGRFGFFVVLAVFIGSTFMPVGNEATLVTQSIALLYMLNIMVGAIPIVIDCCFGQEDFDVVLRENINSWYSVSTGYWARQISALPFHTMIYWVVIGWFMAGQNRPDYPWALAAFILVMMETSAASQGLGYALGLVVDEQTVAYMPFTAFLLFWLFAGYNAPISTLPVELDWIHYFVYIRQSFAATIKLGYPNRGNSTRMPCKEELSLLCSYYKYDDDVLAQLEIDSQPFWSEAWQLLLYAIGFFLLGWLLLALKLYRAKRSASAIK